MIKFKDYKLITEGRYPPWKVCNRWFGPKGQKPVQRIRSENDQKTK